MKIALKAILVLSTCLIVLGTFPVEEASAQGPIIRGLRNRLNDGKPLIPFVADMESAMKPEPPRRLPPSTKQPTPAKTSNSSRTPTPANRAPSSSGRAPTPAKNPAAARTPKPAKKDVEKYPPIKLQSPGNQPKLQEETTQTTAARGFGMAIQQSGDSFFVSQIDPRGNAAAAGVKTGDRIVNVGGAPIKVIAEYEAVGKAMSGGDRVEFEVARRGDKPEKLFVQFGQPDPVKESGEPNEIEVAPTYEPTPSAPTLRTMTDRYEPRNRSGLKSVYDSSDKPSSILTPTPAPTPANRVESLELDLPALDGGK